MEKRSFLLVLWLISSYIAKAQTLQSTTDAGNSTTDNIWVGMSSATGLTPGAINIGGKIKFLGTNTAFDTGALAGNQSTIYRSSPGGTGYPFNNYDNLILQAGFQSRDILFVTGATPTAKMVISGTNGNVGIGTIIPQAPLHVSGIATGMDGGNSYPFTGNLSIQGTSGSKSTTLGAELEFVIPANSDGTNPWGEARIITVPANTNTSDATGKLIMGTRRSFNKLGAGAQWYYGNDITIDGSGNVGVGTLNPQSLLAVAGNITAKQVTVIQTGWSDFVFDSSYQKMSLDEVSQYISLHKHLPHIPSTTEVEQAGLDLGAMQKLHMQKIEELTLYVIDADRHAKAQDSVIAELEETLKTQQQEIEQLKKLIKGQN